MRKSKELVEDNVRTTDDYIFIGRSYTAEEIARFMKERADFSSLRRFWRKIFGAKEGQ